MQDYLIYWIVKVMIMTVYKMMSSSFQLDTCFK